MSERWMRGEPPASENQVLDLIASLFESRTPHTPLGRGHDCAELANLEGALALSTDMFWQDSHFRAAYFTPAEAGAKALSSAVSDLAAAGAVPMGFSLDLLLPPWIGMETLGAALGGMAAKAREYGIVLAGGDLAGGEQLGFSLTVWGGPVRRGAPFLHRCKAEPGDRIFLVGEAGLALVGLLQLERQGRAALEEWPQSCAAHLDPRPLLAEGQALASLAAELTGGGPHIRPQAGSGARPRLALMDVSDGLARDLPRLLGPHGAALALDPAVIPPEVRIASTRLGRPPEQFFLLGGEDYALLGTCPEALWTLVSDAVPAARTLGRVCREPGLFLDGEPFAMDGFDHFSSARGGPWAEPLKDPVVVEAVRRITLIGREAREAGLMAGFNGNISCRLTLQPPAGHGEACLITRSGAAKSRLAPDDFALISLEDGRHLAGPAASSELGLHIDLYKACPQSAVILHTHPPYLLALSLRLPPEERLDLPLPEAERCRERLAYVPYHPPGSAALAEAVTMAAKNGKAVWMERHGLVAHGSDAAQVISLTEELEQLALVQLHRIGVS